MKTYRFLDKKGTFQLEQPEMTSYLYFPIAGEKGLKSSITPLCGGDSKTDQNHFLLQPVSAEELHNNKSSRNFWCMVEGKGVWSATGVSAEAANDRAIGCPEKSQLTAGFMWQTMERTSEKYQLSSRITNFVPIQSENTEMMEIIIKNEGKNEQTITPVGAVPIYGRSADNIRDHRHVTSLLHRIFVKEFGVVVCPTMSFDERGHQKNETAYYVAGMTEDGEAPEAYYPTVEDYIGEGGSLECPGAVYDNIDGVPSGTRVDGMEAIGAMRFRQITLKPGEQKAYYLFMGIENGENDMEKVISQFSDEEKRKEAFRKTKEYWRDTVNVSYHTGDETFDNYMNWVSFQPMLRRIYGCSFLPHHDYGKGGRGWRDLWQDCLALLMMEPDGVKEMLLANFGGVRMDGSNATIIGSKQGEFVADRNNITRVWMDHGLWPLMTTSFYIEQTGDIGFLLKENTFFKDKQVVRGTQIDEQFTVGEEPIQKDAQGKRYYGSILEHLLVQHMTSFYEVGEHNHMRLRGADWNDALDMAPERGESVAFTAAYAGNFETLAELLLQLKKVKNMEYIEVAEEMGKLFCDDETLYEDVERKKALLQQYGESCKHTISGKKTVLPIDALIAELHHKSLWLKEHIRKTEWIADGENGWFNSYYDNHGNAVEGITPEGVRMMLTGQVFSIMSGTATNEQVEKIARSADAYLYREEVGGYRLNTDFKELKMDLGRMFGFAYGQKENGAVFSHMTTMYANALYQRGFAKEGYRALHTLYRQSVRFDTSKIYPGIPEYFDGRGRGMYHYLTGAASWYMMTVIHEMFGIKGRYGELCLEPKLMKEQFDEQGNASIMLWFRGKQWNIVYRNLSGKEYGEYQIGKIYLDGNELRPTTEVVVSGEDYHNLDHGIHELIVELK